MGLSATRMHRIGLTWRLSFAVGVSLLAVASSCGPPGSSGPPPQEGVGTSIGGTTVQGPESQPPDPEKPEDRPEVAAIQELIAKHNPESGRVRFDGDGRVVELFLPACGINDDHLSLVENFESLQVLDLSNATVYGELNRFTGRGLKHIAGLDGLMTLDLAQNDVSDSDLVHLKGLTRLRSLNLSGTAIHGAGLRHIRDCIDLGTLNLSTTRVGDTDLQLLAGLTGLQKLHLSQTPITDSGLANLGSLHHLATLDLSETSVGGDGLSALSKLEGLRELNLERANVTRSGLAALGAIRQLESLDLTGNTLNDEDYALLVGLDRLKRLDTGDGVGGTALEHLAKLRSLETLDLGEDRLSDTDVLAFLRMGHLKHLSIGGGRLHNSVKRELESTLTGVKVNFLHGPPTPRAAIYPGAPRAGVYPGAREPPGSEGSAPEPEATPEVREVISKLQAARRSPETQAGPAGR